MTGLRLPGRSVPLPATLDVAFEWDLVPDSEVEIDLDASAIACDADGRVLTQSHYVFFNNLSSPCGGIRQLRDDDARPGDDLIRVSFPDLDTAVRQILFVLTIYDADTRYLSFDQVADVRVRLIGDGTDLLTRRPDRLLDGTAAVLCGLRRDGEGWVFHPVDEGFPSGMVGISRDHGLDY